MGEVVCVWTLKLSQDRAGHSEESRRFRFVVAFPKLFSSIFHSRLLTRSCTHSDDTESRACHGPGLWLSPTFKWALTPLSLRYAFLSRRCQADIESVPLEPYSWIFIRQLLTVTFGPQVLCPGIRRELHYISIFIGVSRDEQSSGISNISKKAILDQRHSTDPLLFVFLTTKPISTMCDR
ncbi:hypothetical protein BDZ94DRAFT_224615 [Collybia nuda]|uniref:Uncharacterized protein n=1 Tax=Collybia nuda TaxID=64659 RepID=A0A9P6CDZ6_9AGAR|nr:hypothetical protein BDZ94DRAFT_224615 [Collybia nuda]